MFAQPPSKDCPKAACSVSEMAGRCELSRARFYELVKAGVFPQPCHDVQSRRPLYPQELQELCLRIRQTNTGFDGRYVIFNNRRSTVGTPAAQIRKSKPPKPAPPIEKELTELIGGLRTLGVTTPDVQITEAVGACYPDGLPEDQVETAIRTIFRHLRRSNAA